MSYTSIIFYKVFLVWDPIQVSNGQICNKIRRPTKQPCTATVARPEMCAQHCSMSLLIFPEAPSVSKSSGQLKALVIMNSENRTGRFTTAAHKFSKHRNTNYPCLCLCFGFSQITLMLPFLLIILHFSQIGFTDDLTFTVTASFLHRKSPCFQPFCRFQGYTPKAFGYYYNISVRKNQGFHTFFLSTFFTYFLLLKQIFSTKRTTIKKQTGTDLSVPPASPLSV